jgi:Rrf2 family protein
MIAIAELPAGKYKGAETIAQNVEAPRNYLGKLLQTLARRGLVVSQKGVGGGFSLARPAKDISLYDILEPLGDVSRLRGCFLGRQECSDDNPCHVHSSWAPIRDAYIDFLQRTTLAYIAGEGGLERLERFLQSE